MNFIEEDSIKFYLIDYKLLAPSWGLSVIYLKKIILHLSGSVPKNISTNLKYPLIRYTKKDDYKKWKSYYAFEKGTMKTLIAWEAISPKRRVYLEEFIDMTSLLTGNEIQTKKIKDKNYQKIPVNPNVLTIFKQLLKVKENGKRLFINHELPTDNHHYTNLFGSFQDAMFCLYEGRFLTKYNPEKMDEWFRNKYKYYLNPEKQKEAIRKCKGNWDEIKSLALISANNYSKWFDIDKEQYNKNNLPKTINDWIYNIHTKTSMFYVSLLIQPSSAREANAEKMFNSIRPEIRKIFIPLYQEEFDGFTFWNKINNLVKWYDTYVNKLREKDINCCYWLNGKLMDFLDNYKEWLLELSEKLFLNNIGINNNTFDLYIKTKKIEHGIEINIPRSL